MNAERNTNDGDAQHQPYNGPARSQKQTTQNQLQNIAKKSHEAILTNTEESSTYSGNSASGGSAGGAYYKNCKAVWDALGYGVTRNDLGYRSKLNADGDGYACEYPPNY
ncbi:excalibur calcium-binding domain-containing protein [Bifidobacterium catenulatum]|nr:excalibur calcium-binding domain-containing protein [Bifidobacterium catenulatum]KAB7462884.1 excalibur calcium-binding domain-containing protein [Bifidobacterium catenulatum]